VAAKPIQPIGVDDAVHYLVRAADLDPAVNRTIDIGMDETLTYVQMMRRYARVTGLLPRRSAPSRADPRSRLALGGPGHP
jgi:uncharacterized protein YbjT (DUF2867 family)